MCQLQLTNLEMNLDKKIWTKKFGQIFFSNLETPTGKIPVKSETRIHTLMGLIRDNMGRQCV